MFKYQFDELKEKHRVVCINVRGFDATSEKTEPFSLYDIVDDIVNVADSLQLDKFILGGCRWGGIYHYDLPCHIQSVCQD
ncbi:alpha/beta fold hydrolase [Escherichia coli]|uniref:alpha/beta fold hydrolase n=1 Tax=Escherichia coli TaxID=562 RepID=UPI00200A634C|nr:alpha/beta fold hydrolase [Escherichia coli]